MNLLLLAFFFLILLLISRESFSRDQVCPQCGGRIVTAQVFADPNQVSQGLAWNL